MARNFQTDVTAGGIYEEAVAVALRRAGTYVPGSWQGDPSGVGHRDSFGRRDCGGTRRPSVSEYARSFDLDVKELYNTKRVLVRKGAIAGRAEAADEAEPGDFVPVQVAPSSSPSTSSIAVCCIRHPSGLVIECASFPPASWLAALLSGGNDVPA